jgi:hypothetical protein
MCSRRIRGSKQKLRLFKSPARAAVGHRILWGEVEGLRCLVGGTLANGAGALPRTTTALLAMYGLSLE